MAIKKHLLKMLLFLPLLCLTACGVDLGVFEKGDGYKELYESFGKVKTLFDGGNKSYKIEDSLFNDYTVEKMSWEDDDDKVDEKEYLYIILPMEKELKIQCIVLFFYSEAPTSLQFSSFYYVNEDAAPKKIKYRSSPDTEEDEHGEEVEIKYDDPSRDNSIANGSLALAEKQWNNCTFGGFKQEGYDDGYLHTGKEGLFYLRVENNSGFNRDTMTPAKISFINLMVRAV